MLTMRTDRQKKHNRRKMMGKAHIAKYEIQKNYIIKIYLFLCKECNNEIFMKI